MNRFVKYTAAHFQSLMMSRKPSCRIKELKRGEEEIMADANARRYALFQSRTIPPSSSFTAFFPDDVRRDQAF
jgi:hypothetical protein